MGALVAVLVIIVGLAAEVEGLGLEGGGHHIPGRAPAAHVIEGGHLAGDVEGLVVAGGARAHEADLFGDGGEPAQQGQGLEMGGILGRAAQGEVRGVSHRQPVREEKEVELGLFGGLGEAHIMFEIDARVRIRARMAPGGHMMAGVVEKYPEHHLPVTARHAFIPIKRRAHPTART